MAALKVASRNFELESKGILDNGKIEQDLTEVEALLNQNL